MADESTTTLENKIERANEKKVELVEKINELRVVNADLNNDLRDRDETYDRLKEREKIANEEIRTKDRDVEKLRNMVKKRASSALFGGRAAGGGAGGDGDGMGGAPEKEIRPREQIDGLIAQLRGLQAEYIPGGRHLVDPEGNGGAAEITQVTIFYDGGDDSCAFRITPSYTFQELCADASSYWEVAEGTGTLRNEMNAMWPTHANVAKELARYATKPRLRLVVKVTHFLDSLDDVEAKQAGRVAHFEYDDGTGGDAMKSRAEEMIGEARRRMRGELSTFFHTPKLTKESYFQSVEQKGDKGDDNM